ncbi:leucine-rich melanocyte differentiation-associated protein-like [Uloborus diversus]|uniref:leucine-rich melanocyte differentiation-associated protein-like n=1 Tax=Uloborus diversus TaxID=327109 RepID=UPI00240A4469|nr:leucine-rich melanocyte differentiation-associated protein-like [Uloborus diversus]
MKILAKRMITNVQVMFDDQQSINFKVDSEKRICAVYQNMRTIPRELTVNYLQGVEILDISHNNLRDVSALSAAAKLHTLIIDHNLLSSSKNFPRLYSLSVLWVNHNLISDLHDFIPGLARRCPAIRHLSLMGNEACANALTGASEQDQTRYRWLTKRYWTPLSTTCPTAHIALTDIRPPLTTEPQASRMSHH